MKIRNGFVSNSSSSSFILMGYMPNNEEIISLKELALEKYGYDDWSEFIYESEEIKKLGLTIQGEGDYEGVIGKLLVRMSYYELEAKDLSMEELHELSEKIINSLKELGINANTKDIKIYTGTMLC